MPRNKFNYGIKCFEAGRLKLTIKCPRVDVMKMIAKIQLGNSQTELNLGPPRGMSTAKFSFLLL